MSSSNTIPAFHMGGSLTGYLVVFLVPLGKTCSPCRVVSRCPMYVWSTQRGPAGPRGSVSQCPNRTGSHHLYGSHARATRVSGRRWHGMLSAPARFTNRDHAYAPKPTPGGTESNTVCGVQAETRGPRDTTPHLGPAPTRHTAHVLDLSRRVLSPAVVGGG